MEKKKIIISDKKLQVKMQQLENGLKQKGNLAIAFSGGVDSSFLLKVASDIGGTNVLAITLKSPSFPKREIDRAIEFTKKYKIKHILAESNEFENEDFIKNDRLRCYYCKGSEFATIINIAKENGFDFVADGQNKDDISDYRPGADAARELGVISPLKDFGFTKEDIRQLSKQIGLKDWDRPAFACLASRIPYGTTITREVLARIDRLEIFLIKKGFTQVRVRHHGDLARIEIIKEEIPMLVGQHLMEKIVSEFKKAGYLYVTLDLEGYRTGSMNIMIQHDIKNDF